MPIMQQDQVFIVFMYYGTLTAYVATLLTILYHRRNR